MSSTKGCGGKEACQEQRRLREYCFAHSLWDVDLSKSEYNWKQLLKAMPASKSRGLVESGIVKFSFRLLRHVRDHSYCKVDRGGQRIFKTACMNGERWQSHFHKNGNLDNPFRVAPPSSMPRQHGQSLCSAARPAQPSEEGLPASCATRPVRMQCCTACPLC